MTRRHRRISEVIGKALEKGIEFDEPALIVLDGELFVVIKDAMDNLVVEEIGNVISDVDLDLELMDAFEYNGKESVAFNESFETEKEFKDIPADIFKNLTEEYNPDNYKKRRGKDE